jgi:hypothetical protein
MLTACSMVIDGSVSSISSTEAPSLLTHLLQGTPGVLTSCKHYHYRRTINPGFQTGLAHRPEPQRGRINTHARSFPEIISADEKL